MKNRKWIILYIAVILIWIIVYRFPIAHYMKGYWYYFIGDNYKARNEFRSCDLFFNSEEMYRESSYRFFVNCLADEMEKESVSYGNINYAYSHLIDLTGDEEKAQEEAYKAAQRRSEKGDYNGAYEIYDLIEFPDSEQKKKEARYKEGLQEYQKENYVSAYDAFSEAGDYEDAEEKARETGELLYRKAEEYLEAENSMSAYYAFKDCHGFSDSDERAEEIVRVGNDFYFGSRSSDDGDVTMEWRIIGREDNKLLLLSLYPEPKAWGYGSTLGRDYSWHVQKTGYYLRIQSYGHLTVDELTEYLPDEEDRRFGEKDWWLREKDGIYYAVDPEGRLLSGSSAAFADKDRETRLAMWLRLMTY